MKHAIEGLKNKLVWLKKENKELRDSANEHIKRTEQLEYFIKTNEKCMKEVEDETKDLRPMLPPETKP